MNAQAMSGSICRSSIHPFAAMPTAKRTRGSSRTSERTCKPWLAEGVSQRTYYRRKAAAAAQVPTPPAQHSAHVVAWYEAADPFVRLEYRALMRRCLRGGA